MFQILLCLQHAPGFTHTAGHIGFTPPFTVRKFLHFTLQPLLMLCICRAYFGFMALSSLNSVVKQINVAETLVTGIWKNPPSESQTQFQTLLCMTAVLLNPISKLTKYHFHKFTIHE